MFCFFTYIISFSWFESSLLMLFVKNPQMAGLCWMAVTLSVLLYAGSSFADVDQNHLAGIVKEIVDKWVDFLQNRDLDLVQIQVWLSFSKLNDRHTDHLHLPFHKTKHTTTTTYYKLLKTIWNAKADVIKGVKKKLTSNVIHDVWLVLIMSLFLNIMSMYFLYICIYVHFVFAIAI